MQKQNTCKPLEIIQKRAFPRYIRLSPIGQQLQNLFLLFTPAPWLRTLGLEAFDRSQLFKDLEASQSAFFCTERFIVTATASGIQGAAGYDGQPGTVGAILVLKAHHVTRLHRSNIHYVFVEDLESGANVGQPFVPRHGAYGSVKTKIKFPNGNASQSY